METGKILVVGPVNGDGRNRGVFRIRVLASTPNSGMFHADAGEHIEIPKLDVALQIGRAHGFRNYAGNCRGLNSLS